MTRWEVVYICSHYSSHICSSICVITIILKKRWKKRWHGVSSLLKSIYVTGGEFGGNLLELTSPYIFTGKYIKVAFVKIYELVKIHCKFLGNISYQISIKWILWSYFFGRYLKSSRWLGSLNQPQNGPVKDFEHVLREIEFHNCGSAASGAYMMFKGATSRTDVSSTSKQPIWSQRVSIILFANHFGGSACVLKCHKKETQSS